MTKEEALKSFEEENKDFEKTFERYGYQMSPEEVSAVKEAIERNKVAISALSTEGEYIKKSEALSKANYYETGLITGFEYVKTKDLNSLPSYSFPDSAENKGEWKMPIQDDGMSDPIYYQVRCSKCGFDLDPQTWHQELHQYGADNFCPNCGADMRGGKDK